MQNTHIVPIYLLIAEISAWLMGTRLLSLMRSSQALHPIELVTVAITLWRFRSCYRCVLPYKSVPVIILLLSLIFQLSMEYKHHATLWSLFSSGFAVPVYEELIYRVIITDVIKRRLGKISPNRVLYGVMILIPSFLFAFAHRLTVESFPDILVCLVSGLALSSTYCVSRKNLVEPLAIHVLHNLHVLMIKEPDGSVVVSLCFYSAIFVVNIIRLDREL